MLPWWAGVTLSNESGCSLHLRMLEGRRKICQFSLGQANFLTQRDLPPILNRSMHFAQNGEEK